MRQEKVVLTRARIKKQGKNFEVVVDPQAAAEFREGKLLDVKDVLKDIHVYTDVNKGLRCKDEELRSAFGTDDALEVAKEIIIKGDVPLTAEQRSAKREQKKREIISLIRKYGVDPRTNAPHPETRIENALTEAKVKIDDYKPADQQVKEILPKLQPIIPIKFATKRIEVNIPAQYAQQSYATVKRFGAITKEQWLQDGAWSVQVQVPAGLEADFYDELNKITRGTVETKVIGE